MFNGRGKFQFISHGEGNVMILDKRDDAINRPRGWRVCDVEEAGDGEAERRETGTVGVEVGRGLRGEETETAARGDARLTQTVVIPDVIVAGQKRETRRESDPVQIEKRRNL